MSATSRISGVPVDRDGRPVTADEILEVAGNIVERHGVDALTMRRLSDDLGVAVTSIYWHVGNRDAVLDGLVDRLLDRMETIRALGDTPLERMASLSFEPVGSTPAAFGVFLEAELTKWAKVAKEAGARAE